MGKETKIEFAQGTTKHKIRAHLDSNQLELGSPVSRKIPLAKISKAETKGGMLHIKFESQSFTLALGEKEAAAWAKKITNPPSLSDKLGLAKADKILVTGAAPPEIREACQTTPGVTTSEKIPAKLAAGLVIHTLQADKEVQEITSLAKKLAAGTPAWLVYEKGKPFNGDKLIAAARAQGLKDTKVARVSETHAALRFIKQAE